MASPDDLSSITTTIRQHLAAHPLAFGVAHILLSLTAIAFISANRSRNHAPALADPIPYFWNSYQYMTNQAGFLARVARALHNHPITSFHIGPHKFYMLKSSRSVQALFRTSPALSSNRFMHMVFEHLMGFTPADLAKFDHDLSGRGAVPIPVSGSEKNVPADKERYWASYHRILHEYLSRAHETNALGVIYQRLFGARMVDKYPVGEWTTVSVKEMLEREVLLAAVETFCGPKMVEVNPDFVQVFWEFHDVAQGLVYGLPRWMNRRAVERRERFLGACGRYLDVAFGEEGFDWEGEEGRKDWEPVWGSSANRELCRWFRDAGFAMVSQAGSLAISNVFAANSNSIPFITWIMMELVQDPALLNAVRNEVATALITDPTTQEKTLDIPKMLALPLLQSIYSEVLRMHMSVHITREVMEPVVIEGYLLEKGAIVQGPVEIIHYDERNWGAEGHPASEFWAYRHVKYVEERDEKGEVRKDSVPQFSMTGRTSEFVPFGGGVSMCPGRFFAKQEILMTVSLLVSRFDIEFSEWTNLEDGSPSDRPAQNHAKFVGGASVPPDRDMKVRWKRLW